MVDEPKEPPDSPSVEPGKPEKLTAPGTTRQEKQYSMAENAALPGTPDAVADLRADTGKAGGTATGDPGPIKPVPESNQSAERATTAESQNAARLAEAKSRIEATKQTATATAADGNAQAPRPPIKKKDPEPVPLDAMDHELVQRLRREFGQAVIEAMQFLGQLSVLVQGSRIVDICLFLRDLEVSPFNYLSDLTCVHRPEQVETPFQVVYNLYSIPANERVRLKVNLTEGGGVDSVTSVWPSANWLEREVYDLFGVTFNNHPDLRRILLPPDWEGHPLRKDYPLKFVENQWTERHLPEFTEVQKEQLEQRRAYGLELLSVPEERQMREIMLNGKEPMPLDRK
jgi:NADH-quinone oxidoreductase subunit C